MIKAVHYKAYVYETPSILVAFPFTEAHVFPEHPRQSYLCSVKILLHLMSTSSVFVVSFRDAATLLPSLALYDSLVGCVSN